MKWLIKLNQLLARRFVLFYGFFLVVTPICLFFYAKARLTQGEFDPTPLAEFYLYVMALGAILELLRRRFPSIFK